MTIASSAFLAALPVLITLYAEKYRTEDLSLFLAGGDTTGNVGRPNYGLPVKETFDFIIVGGGTSGCILANRLSEKYTVLLLEIGGNPPPPQDVPFTWHITKDYPEINYLYKSVPQKNAALEDGGVVKLQSGKMMGGNSAHNGMTYERGSPEVYDEWAKVTEDDSWAYKNILKYFIKSEKYSGTNPLRENDQHGREGPMHTEDDDFSPVRDVWLEAGRELGFNVLDSNGPNKEGFSTTIFTQRNGRRESSYSAYIKPIEQSRKSLSVYRYSAVSKILFEGKKAIGVEFKRHGVPKVAFASKEVIISAGVYASPLILIKSGIGSAEQLKSANVEPVAILPGVGENYMDHPMLHLGPIFVNPPYSWVVEANLTFENVDEFIHHGKGPLASVWHGNTAAFIKSKRRGETLSYPDLQLYHLYSGGEPGSNSMFIGSNHVSSRGSIRLNTSAIAMDDDNLPIIDVGIFHDPEDLEVAIDGIEFALTILENTTAFNNIGARLSSTPYASCTELPFRSREYWKCYARYTARSAWHGVGTCKMGQSSDPTAVVDSQLKVIGVDNLRVVDASIMPFITNANTMAPVLAIGEKAAAQILQQYESRCSDAKEEL